MISYDVAEFGAPLQWRERETPVPQGSEVLLRTLAAGVCHSDLHLWEGGYDLGQGRRMSVADRGVTPPFTMGHEISGEVVAVGPAVVGVGISEKYLVFPWIGCGECPVCRGGEEQLCAKPASLGVFRPGGYGDHVLVPHQRYLIPLDGLSPAEAAPYACSGVTTFGALRKLGNVIETDPIVLMGAGGLGLMCLTLLKAMGGRGNIVVLEGPDNIPTAIGRLRGFKDALKEFPDVKVVLSKNAMYARPAASDLLKTMLKANPNQQVDGVLAANDAMALGAIEAFKEAKKKMSPIVGINASKEAVDLIKAGDMLASGDYNGLVEGCLGAEIAIRTLRKQPVPKEVMAKTSVVDKANYQQYETPAERRPCPTLESMGAK